MVEKLNYMKKYYNINYSEKICKEEKTSSKKKSRKHANADFILNDTSNFSRMNEKSRSKDSESIYMENSKKSKEIIPKIRKMNASVSEIFSPPRVAARANEFGLSSGFSIDLTVRKHSARRARWLVARPRAMPERGAPRTGVPA